MTSNMGRGENGNNEFSGTAKGQKICRVRQADQATSVGLRLNTRNRHEKKTVNRSLA